MNYEKLSPNLIPELLEKRLIELKAVLEKIRRSVKTPPPGRLRISQKGNSTEYYHITSPTDLHGKYIPMKQEAIARQLAQKDYDSKITALIEEEICATKRYLKQICSTSSGGNPRSGRSPDTCPSTTTKLNGLYANLCPARQRLITPLTLTGSQYAAQWQSVSWPQRPFPEDSTAYTTIRGERVRSKSEVLIADALARNNIPYRYEFPLQLRRGANSKSGNFDKLNHQTEITVHPDFLCLNVRTRQEFYWEHFGLMDNPEYSNNAAGKLRLYTENGILAGRNLIITMETQSEPLSTRTVDQMISNFLK